MRTADILSPHDDVRQALRLLSTPSTARSDSAHGWTRRHFLQAIGAGAVVGPMVGSFGRTIEGALGDLAIAAPSVGPQQGILIVISLYGGNDGLNTVVPYGAGAYYDRRPGVAVTPDQVLTLDGQIGLHPRLTYLKALADAGQVAIVEGAGCPQPDFSHFRSMGTWMDGSFVGGGGAGWVGRWLDGQSADQADLLAASIDLSVPLHMTGSIRRAVGISPGGDGFGADISADKRRLYDSVRAMSAASAGRGGFHDLFATTMRAQLDLVADIAPVFELEQPTGELARKLTVAARLINADLGLRVFDVARSGFDNHESEVRSHAEVLADLDEGLRWFFATLAPSERNRVTLMTVSEFGRTPASNGSGGTDHGTAAPMFVIGAAVRGGRYGAPPSLTALTAEGQMVATLDFRAVYGSVIDGWMGGGGSAILGGSFENLGLFRSGPGAPLTGRPTPIQVSPSASAAGYTPVQPSRILDTREGTGGRSTPLGASETWNLVIRGQFGVAADATAVAMNVTAVDASQPSYVTVWPSGMRRPVASNLNPIPGRAVPNLVISRFGDDGSVDLYNNSGTVHLVADVVGYMSPSSTTGLVPLVPARVLDTRDGTGAARAAIGSGSSLTLRVTGTAGVPNGSAAVALNVAVTEPSEPSYLTVWPTGHERPLASNLNMVSGQTVSNLVLTGVGTDGTVQLFNNGGTTHMVVDVLGCFSSNGGGRFVALPPSRVLDTREGHGSELARVGQNELVVQMLGHGGLPAGGVGAVVMNVTGVSPTRDTFVTVYPAGIERPLAANVNLAAGDITPNMVIARLGDDGSVAFFNHSGSIDLVADVVGYFESV